MLNILKSQVRAFLQDWKADKKNYYCSERPETEPVLMQPSLLDILEWLAKE